MRSSKAGKMMPTWALIAMAAFVLVVIACLVALLLQEVPPHAGPQAVEKRFAPQIECLKELSLIYELEDFAIDPDKIAEIAKQGKDPTKGQAGFWEKADAAEGLFADPAILGASVILYQGNMKISARVKEDDEPEDMWSPFEVFGSSPEVDSARTSLWYSGVKKIIKYEKLTLNEAGTKKGYELILDLERLEPQTPADPGASSERREGTPQK
jgi:hypothetical protein